MKQPPIPAKTRVGRFGPYPLAISPRFFHHLGRLGSCLRPPGAQGRAVSSAVPICECTQPHRWHPCKRDMDSTATASPDSATSNAFPQCRVSWVLGSGDGLWCKRFVRARHGLVVHGIRAVRADKPGVFRPARSDRCKVPDIVLPPLAWHDKRDAYHGSMNRESQVPTPNAPNPTVPFSLHFVYPCKQIGMTTTHGCANLVHGKKAMCYHGQICGVIIAIELNVLCPSMSGAVCRGVDSTPAFSVSCLASLSTSTKTTKNRRSRKYQDIQRQNATLVH